MKANGHELLGGEEAVVGAIAIPPGATLYGGYSRGDVGYGVQAQTSGPIIDAITSKAAKSAAGLAGRMPRQQGALLLTSHRLLFLKLTRLTGKPKELLAEWSSDELDSAIVAMGQGYPFLDIEFTDHSVVRVYSEKKGGLAELSDAVFDWLSQA